jgi:FlaA1/EpsC-like NDP-sugar epimerase
LQDATALGRSVGLVFVISVVWRVFDPGLLAGEHVPYGILVIYAFLSFGAFVGARLTRRILFERAGATKPTPAQATIRRRLLLAGAGEAGLHLLRELREDFEVVGFIDDNQELQGRTIGGWRILGTTHDLETVIHSHRVDEVILCMPSAPRSVVQRIVARCARLSIKTPCQLVNSDP